MAAYQQNSAGRWKAIVRRKGQKPVISTFDTKPKARAWARHVESQLDRGLFEDLTAAKTTTLIDAMEQYSSAYTDGKKGARQERDRVKLWAKQDLAQRALADIKPKDISIWVKCMDTAGKAPSTIRNMLTLVSQTFKFAHTELGIDGLKNPVPGVKLPRSNPGRDRRLEAGELERLLEAAQSLREGVFGDRYPILHDMIIVAVETAMRRSELLSLRLEDLQGYSLDGRRQASNTARIRQSKTDRDGKKGRLVPLSPKAAEVLRGRGREGLAFPFEDAREMERAWYKGA